LKRRQKLVTLTFVVVSQLFGLFALSHRICPRGGRRESIRRSRSRW
jgi:hypothetical protein